MSKTLQYLYSYFIQTSYFHGWVGVGCKKGGLKGIEANEIVAWSIATFSAKKIDDDDNVQNYDDDDGVGWGVSEKLQIS